VVPTDIIPVDLLSLMKRFGSPFIISVQPKDLYDKGHIKGAYGLISRPFSSPIT